MKGEKLTFQNLRVKSVQNGKSWLKMNDHREENVQIETKKVRRITQKVNFKMTLLLCSMIR